MSNVEPLPTKPLTNKQLADEIYNLQCLVELVMNTVVPNDISGAAEYGLKIMDGKLADLACTYETLAMEENQPDLCKAKQETA